MKTQTILTKLFLVALTFSVSIALAQNAPEKQWDARFGGHNLERLHSIQQSADAGCILGGMSRSGSSGDKTQASQGSDDYWIVKTDANGGKQWDARFGGSGTDYLYSLRQTADGGYILGGYTTSGISGDQTQASQGMEDYWIVKTDVKGVKQWDARFGGLSTDVLSFLQQTADGGYILGGSSSSGISGDKTQASQGYSDYWIVKTDANGEMQWDARFGGSGYDNLLSIQQTVEGGYIMGGHSGSGISGDKTQASQGNYDYWIVKTDANGVKQWDARFGGSEDDYFHSLQQIADGGYVLGGFSYSGISGDKTQASQGYSDYWIVKTDANGVKQWDARFGGSDYEELYSLEQTADGEYILGGSSYSGISGDKTQAGHGGADYWIVKTDVSGMKQWDARFGGSRNDFFDALQQTADGGYLLGGYSESGISGDKTQASQGLQDYWIVKVAPEAVANCNTTTSLSTISITSTTAKLQWNAVGEAIGYKVRYKVAGISEWTNIQSPNSNKILIGLAASTEYVWQVKSICSTQPIVSSDWSEKQFFTTDALRLAEVHETMLEVYPNPVSKSATISFFLNEASPVVMEIMDVNGRSRRVIVDENFSEGIHEVTFNRESLIGGIYFLQAKNNEGVMMKKIMIE